MRRLIVLCISAAVIVSALAVILCVPCVAKPEQGLLTLTAYADKPKSDGSLIVSVYAEDDTAYGLFAISAAIDFDSSVYEWAPVEQDGQPVFADVTQLRGLLDGYSRIGLGMDRFAGDSCVLGAVYDRESGQKRAENISFTLSVPGISAPIRFARSAYTAPDDIGFDERGFLLARYYLRVKKGRNINGTSITPVICDKNTYIATDDKAYYQNDTINYRRIGNDEYRCIPVTFSDIYANTYDSAQIKWEHDGDEKKTGLRFIGDLTVPAKYKSMVSDFGIVIDDHLDEHPTRSDGIQTKLMISARVSRSGQTIIGEDGTIMWPAPSGGEYRFCFSAVISDIKVTNFSRKYTARVYCRLNDGSYLYGEELTRSVEDIYTAMQNDQTMNEGALSWVKEWFSK